MKIWQTKACSEREGCDACRQAVQRGRSNSAAVMHTTNKTFILTVLTGNTHKFKMEWIYAFLQTQFGENSCSLSNKLSQETWQMVRGVESKCDQAPPWRNHKTDNLAVFYKAILSHCPVKVFTHPNFLAWSLVKTPNFFRRSLYLNKAVHKSYFTKGSSNERVSFGSLTHITCIANEQLSYSS